MFPTITQNMKHISVALQMLLTTTALVWAESWQLLVLNVAGIEANRGGQIQVFVFQKDGFPTKHQKALKSYSIPVSGSEITISMEAPAGTPFALKIHHDEDGNGRVTKNWTGIFPIEGMGFSAGARIRMRPPAFADAKMIMPESGAVSIIMRYP